MRKKVLHILNTGSYSGAENVAITIINNTKDAVESVYLSLDGSIREVLRENGIRFYPVSKLSVKNIKKAIKQINPDIIHAHDFTAGIISSLSTRKIPIVNHLHNNSPWIKSLCVKSVAYLFSALSYRKILTVSNSVMDEYIFGSLLRKKTSVIGNPIDIKGIRTKLNNTDIEPSDILFLGRLVSQKNPIFFLEIINELKKSLPALKVSMVGDGELRASVEQKIKELSLESTVTLYGFKKNPYDFIEKTKVLCIPSLWEGFGLAAVEALSLGKPVAASPVGGLTSIVNKDCGCLCNSLDEFTNELKGLLSEQKFYNEKSKGALERAMDLNNIENYINSMLDIYMKN